MVIERKKDEIIVHLSPETDVNELQNMIEYLKYKENAINTEVKQEQVDKISDEINASIWQKIKSKRGL